MTAIYLSCTAYPLGVFSQWVYPSRLGTKWDIQPQERGRPIIIGDQLFLGNLSGEVVAMHRLEGYPLWKTKIGAPIDGAISYSRSKIFVGDTKGKLYALKAHDGSYAWDKPFVSRSEWLSPPTVFRDKLVVSNSAEEVFLLSEATGKEIWHFSHRGDEKMTVRGTGISTVYENAVYVGFADGHLVALSLDKGIVLWDRRLRKRERFYDIDMAPYVDDRGVLAATFDGQLYNMNRLTGEFKWVLPIGSYGGFLVEGETVYLGALNGKVMAIDRTTGAVKWATQLTSGVPLTPTRSGNYLVVATSSDPVFIIDPKDGKIIESKSLGAGTLAAASGTEDGWFYAMSNYGVLTSYWIRPEVNFTRLPTTHQSLSALHRHRE